MKDQFYGRLYRFGRAVCRIFGGRRYRLNDTPPQGPVVYVGHHQNLRGPFHTMQWFEPPIHLWVLHVFFDRQACFDQYYGYTLTQRMHWPKPLAYAAAQLFSRVVSALMASMRAIPVYRGTVHMRKTLQMSMDALLAGESLAIFPDIDYSSNEETMGEIYSGFMGLERFYFKKTGKHLSFVPLGVDIRQHRFSLGDPVRFADDIPYQQQKDALALLLRDRINQLAEDSDPKTENFSASL